MLDIRLIRQDPDRFRQGLARRGASTEPIDELLRLDEERRKFLTQSEGLKAERNRVSKQISELKKAGQDAGEMISATREVSAQIKTLDDDIRSLQEQQDLLLLETPNLPHPSVPDGKDETDNPVIRTWGEPPSFDFEPKPHWDLGEALDIMDFEAGVKVSGSRFYILKGWGARLERALINFMLDVHREEFGCTEIWPPVLISRESMTGTGQLPKFEFDMYRIEGEELFLAPTAEVPVTNMLRDEILAEADLPLNYVAYTPCFRKEAGAAGRDTRGMTRVHQFDKVEIVKFCTAEASYDELEKLTAQAERILQLLELPYRVLEMCAGDLGDKGTKQYDPEVWMPGQDRWVEISSCSSFEDYQARRMNVRYRPEGGGRPEFVHTLNGSGLAVGRTLAAIVENCQREDGSFAIPEALRPYVGGAESVPA